jgi:hypothetical protein
VSEDIYMCVCVCVCVCAHIYNVHARTHSENLDLLHLNFGDDFWILPAITWNFPSLLSSPEI